MCDHKLQAKASGGRFGKRRPLCLTLRAPVNAPAARGEIARASPARPAETMTVVGVKYRHPHAYQLRGVAFVRASRRSRFPWLFRGSRAGCQPLPYD